MNVSYQHFYIRVYQRHCILTARGAFAVSKLHSHLGLGLGNNTTWLGLVKDHVLG